MKKIGYGIFFSFCFFLGIYVWKVVTMAPYNHATETQRKVNKHPHQVLVEIEGLPITRQDVDFELQLLTQSLIDDKEGSSPSSSFGQKSQHEVVLPLKENIINNLIERKMLYHMVKSDQNFDLGDPSRYISCLDQWTQIIAQKGPNGLNLEQQERLKTRLCEQNILEQYLKEKIYQQISISDTQIQEYYQNHQGEFQQPAMVLIRQIVLANEVEARKILRQVNHNNFADLAKAYSITPEAQKGGRLKPFARGQGMPRFFDVAFSMRPDQISDILKSTYGFHIIMLEDKLKARTLSYEEAAHHIRTKLLRLEEERAYRKWVDLALHSIKISTPTAYW